ncbi:major facilitator superfamily domain-containing protein [Syncephalis fuscata]|nr:major facilitator superfamily domain-containing protein [Syncephalis fuscata]
MAIYKRFKSAIEDEMDVVAHLPKKQLFVAAFCYAAGIIAITTCYPFLHQVSNFYPDSKAADVGIFVGIFLSVMNTANALGSIGWGWIADRFGRRPPLLVAQFGSVLCPLIIGIAPTFSIAILGITLLGFLNGSLSIWRTIVGELTSVRTQAYGFRLLSLGYGAANTIGPIIGGYLSKSMPKPSINSVSIFTLYPYLLPLLMSTTLLAVGFIMSLCFNKETLKKHDKSDKASEHDTDKLVAELLDVEQIKQIKQLIPEKLALRHLFTHPMLRSCIPPMVAITVAYLIHSSFIALILVWLPTAVEDGGLSMLPKQIGTLVAFSGIVNVFTHSVLYVPMQYFAGSLKLFQIGLLIELPAILVLPLLQAIVATDATVGSLPVYIWVGVALCIGAHSFAMSLTTTSSLLLFNDAASRTGMLGILNGLTWGLSSLAYGISPIFTSTVWGWSVNSGLPFPFNSLLIWSSLAGLSAISFVFSHWMEADVPPRLITKTV